MLNSYNIITALLEENKLLKEDITNKNFIDERTNFKKSE